MKYTNMALWKAIESFFQHIGTDHFVHYREVVHKNVLPLYRLVHWKVSFIKRCPLFRVSFIRGSTVSLLRDVSDNELTNDSISSRAFGGLVNLMTL